MSPELFVSPDYGLNDVNLWKQTAEVTGAANELSAKRLKPFRHPVYWLFIPGDTGLAGNFGGRPGAGIKAVCIFRSGRYAGCPGKDIPRIAGRR